MPSLDAASSAPYAMSTNAGTVTPNVHHSMRRGARGLRVLVASEIARAAGPHEAHEAEHEHGARDHGSHVPYGAVQRLRDVDVLPGEPDEPEHEHARHDREHELHAGEQGVPEERDQQRDGEAAREADEQQLALADRSVEFRTDEHDRDG